MKRETEMRSALTWRVMMAFIFATFIVQPALIYYTLITNVVMPFQAWFVIILWSELAHILGMGLTKQELFMLLVFQPVSLMYAMTFVTLIKNAYYLTTEPAMYFGLSKIAPEWWAPRPEVYFTLIKVKWIFLHPAWRLPILITLVTTVLMVLMDISLGMFLYQYFVVVQRLEFPAASAQARTVVILAERPKDLMRVLLVSALIGMVANASMKFIPFILGPLLYGGGVQYYIPSPFVDFTDYLDYILPGAGFAFSPDPVFYVPGFLLPIGVSGAQLAGAIAFYIIGTHIITRLQLWPPESPWTTGWGYWRLVERAGLYFYTSVFIGLGLAFMIASILASPRAFASMFRIKGGGARIVKWLLLYLASTIVLTVLIMFLVPGFPPWILVLFTIGAPFFVNFLSAGAAGVTFYGVNVPYMREFMIYYSGYKGKDIWFAPLPLPTYGYGITAGLAIQTIGGSGFAQALRQADLCEANHSDVVKGYLLLVALGLASSFFYTMLLWNIAPIPSSAYPATITSWPVDALTWSRTMIWIWHGYLFRTPLILGSMIAGIAGQLIAHLLLRAPYLLISFMAGAMMGIPFALAQFVGTLVSETIIGPRIGIERWRTLRWYVVTGYIVGDSFMEAIRASIVLILKSMWLLPY